MKTPICALLLAVSAFCQPTPTPTTVVRPGTAERLTGRFFDFALTDQPSIAAYLDEMAGLGMDTLVTIGSRQKFAPGGDCKLAYWDWAEPGAEATIGILLQEAAARSIHVYLGLLVDPATCYDDIQDAADQAGWLVRYIVQRYNSPALSGWFDGEPYLLGDFTWFSGATQASIDYFGPLVKSVRRYSSLPIATAPYLVSWAADPQAAGAVAKYFLDATGIDILIYQDYMASRSSSVTANLGWKGAIGIREFFAAISAAVGREHLWVDHEIWQSYGGWVAASLTRVNQQIAAVPDSEVSKRLAWIDEDFLSAVSPVRFAGADRLLAGYKATRGFGGSYIYPKSVYWWTTWDPQHPDIQGPVPSGSNPCSTYYHSSKLLDGVVGDAFDVDGAEWVGFLGSASLCADLGRFELVDWVSLHVGQAAARGVFRPQSVAIYGSSDGHFWTQLSSDAIAGPGSVAPPQEAQRSPGYVLGDGEWSAGNLKPLGALVRYLWVSLANANDAKTRVSELEITGR